MKTYITEEQKRELEMLGNEGHAEAIIAAMADMYHEGWKDAGKFAKIICCTTAEVAGISCVVYLLCKKCKYVTRLRNSNKDKES